jgi:prepilin-type N-terminal cleavage/methylation domain-containing protein
MQMIRPSIRGATGDSRACHKVEAASCRFHFLHPRGFTLLELLVSMAVMSLVLLVLLQTTSVSLNMWRASERKISAGREGRGALQLIDQDFKSMFAPTNPALRPTLVGNTGFRFLTLKPLDFQDTTPPAKVGDVCFVEYRFANNAIERGSVDSKPTFDALTGGSAALPAPSTFHIVATNVIEAVWMTNNGYVQLFFKAAPSADALNNYISGINTNNQQVEQFFFQGKLP